MEGIIFEGISVGVSIVAFIGVGAVATGVFLAWMREEEHTGASLTWAEWPLPGLEPVAPPEREEIRLAA